MFGAQGNKSSAGREATNKRDTRPALRAHPNCNLDRLAELSFEFDQAGKIIDCIGTIKDGGNIDHDYAGGKLACLYERARRQIGSSANQRNDFAIPRWREATRPTGLGMLEISEAGSAWPSTAAPDRGLGRPVAGRGRARIRGCRTQPSLI
jgi:hypothetical protein